MSGSSDPNTDPSLNTTSNSDSTISEDDGLYVTQTSLHRHLRYRNEPQLSCPSATITSRRMIAEMEAARQRKHSRLALPVFLFNAPHNGDGIIMDPVPVSEVIRHDSLHDALPTEIHSPPSDSVSLSSFDSQDITIGLEWSDSDEDPDLMPRPHRPEPLDIDVLDQGYGFIDGLADNNGRSVARNLVRLDGMLLSPIDSSHSNTSIPSLHQRSSSQNNAVVNFNYRREDVGTEYAGELFRVGNDNHDSFEFNYPARTPINNNNECGLVDYQSESSVSASNSFLRDYPVIAEELVYDNNESEDFEERPANFLGFGEEMMEIPELVESIDEEQ